MVTVALFLEYPGKCLQTSQSVHLPHSLVERTLSVLRLGPRVSFRGSQHSRVHSFCMLPSSAHTCCFPPEPPSGCWGPLPAGTEQKCLLGIYSPWGGRCSWVTAGLGIKVQLSHCGRWPGGQILKCNIF